MAVASCWAVDALRRGRGSRVEGAAAGILESTKRRKYPHLHVSLFPLVCEAHGRLGVSLLSWLRALAPPPQNKAARSAALSEVYHTWASTLQRGNAAAILTTAAAPT